MHPFLNTAIKAAREAGRMIVRTLDDGIALEVGTKGLNDLVTEVDKAAESLIKEIIRKAYPSHSILAEESGLDESKNNSDQNLWIIDPLDGTMNFIHGIPHFCVSIALQHRGNLEIAVIYDPVRDDLFTAQRGAGAQRNNRRMRVSSTLNMKEALFSTGFPYQQQADYTSYFQLMQEVCEKTHGIRRLGSAALDLAYVAAGYIDGFWQVGLSEWDVAAGALLIKEAGGMVADFNGGEDYLAGKNIIATNAKLFKPMLQMIQPYRNKLLA